MLKTVTRLILTAVASLGVVPLMMLSAQAVEITPDLELRVNRLSGETRILTTGMPATGADTNGTADLDTYTITGNTASDVWISDNWTSLTDANAIDWVEVPPGGSTTQLGELRLTGSNPYAFGDIIPLGNIYDTTDVNESITFLYGLDGNDTTIAGNVVFEGLVVTPTLELRVNRLTGVTRIVAGGGSIDPADQNVPADLDTYTITGNTASDVWVSDNWTSLTDANPVDWVEVPPGGSTTQLGELRLTGSNPVSSGEEISLGTIYDTTDVNESITFLYGLDGDDTTLAGNVVFEGVIVTADLELRVNRFTGETRIVGTGGATDPADVDVPADLDTYTITGNTASDVWVSDNWTSLTDANAVDWVEVPPGGSTTQLGELRLTGSDPVSTGEEISLGTIYDITDTDKDITFLYGLDGSDATIAGNVVFDGVGLRLRVNKTTGKVEIVNGETAGVDFNAYQILSTSGDLNATTWISLEDQAVPEWQETNSSSFGIAETNLVSSSVLASGSVFDLGAAYQGGIFGTEDLSFLFNQPGAELASGVIEYIIGGDMDGDGDVDEFDAPLIVEALVNRQSYDDRELESAAGFLIDADINGDVNGNGIFDLGDVASFSALPQFGSASASAVPEPASAGLLFVGLSALGLVGRRRKEQ